MASNIFEMDFRTSPVAQLYVERGGRISVGNEAFAQRLNLAPGDLEGRFLEKLMDAPTFPAALLTAVTDASPGVVLLEGGELRLRCITLPDRSVCAVRVDFVSTAPGTLNDSRAWCVAGPVQLWHTDAAGGALPLPLADGAAVEPLHPADKDVYAQAFEAARSAGTAFSVTARWLSPGGGYQWKRSVGSPVTGPRGEVVRWVGASMPVDELVLEAREREEELRAARRRIEELDSFVSLLAHEVSAPARGLGTVASMILEDSRNADLGFTKKSLELLEDRALVLTRIVDNLLAFARFDAPRDIERIKPEPVIEEVLKLLTPGRRTRVDVVAPLPELFCSRSAFQQVMTNLIGNAIKVGAKNVMVRGTREDDSVHFEVDDDGPGIPPAEQERVWNLFHTTKPTLDSLGVGLAVVRKVVERSGGSVDLESEVGRGTVFHLRLPFKA